jgi:nicotinate-nucleotide adenylyltransferase
MNHPRRLGILGGTFDPIHVGHLDAARAAQEALGLDEIWLLPTHVPPHRAVDPRSTPYHRFTLAALAVADSASWRVSDLELLRGGPSYTADTLRALAAQGWTPGQLHFIVGGDAFAEVGSWHDFPALLELAHFVVIDRPGARAREAVQRLPTIAARLALPTRDWNEPGPTRVFQVEADTRDVSSTAIRSALATGADITTMVPACVAAHIRKYHLYGAAHDAHGQDTSPSTRRHHH